MNNRKSRVCPVERAGSLDLRLRRWFQNPIKILGPYVDEGMIVLDLGCGPGFFTIDMARMIGSSGRVIAADLQDGMLKRLEEKIKGTPLKDRITLHQCREEDIGVSGPVDFCLAFYMLHEVPNQMELFRQIKALLRSKGLLLIVEPPFHVTRSAFEKTLENAKQTGFKLIERPKVFLSKTALLEN